MVMVKEKLFFIVFMTTLSLQREHRLKSLDECSNAVKFKHKGNDLYGVFCIFSISWSSFEKTKTKTKAQKKQNWRIETVTLG